MAEPIHSKRPGPAGTSGKGIDGILTRIRTAHLTMPTVSKRIAEYVIEHAQDIVHMSVTEIAELLQVSEGSIVRFCQQLGLKGFQDLKISLSRELVAPVQFIHEDVREKDDPEAVLDKIFQSNVQALLDTLKVIDRTQLRRAVTAIVNAERVEFYGIGSAAPVAIDAHYRMMRIGIKCSVYTDSHVQAVSAGLTDPSVATVTISHSGSTMETLAATRLAKQAGATTIIVTNYGKSPLQAYADIVLHTAARETQFRTEAMTSRIAELSVIDALTTCVALATYQRSVETINHTFDILSSKRF
jgi:DNA-binding MurR/RpiR family transcriptional regulator